MEETKGGDDDPAADFLVAIFEDLRHVERELKRDDLPHMRRAYIRTTFSAVEGFAHALKRIALGKPELFGPDELALLSEEYRPAGAGEVRVVRRFLRTADNLRFAFSAFMKFHGKESALPADEGWSNFLAAIEVRNGSRIRNARRILRSRTSTSGLSVAQLVGLH
jgi:hypothetical protein